MHGVIFSFSVGTSLGPLLAAPFLGNQPQISGTFSSDSTGISSHLGAKLRDWAHRQAEAGCYSWAALSSNDSKTWYRDHRPLPADRVFGLGERLELPRPRPQRLPGTENGEEDRSGAAGWCQVNSQFTPTQSRSHFN